MDCSILNLTLFQRGHVYAPDDLGQQDILVANGKIVAIAPTIAAKDFPGCQQVDLHGDIVCPGFIDQHVHLIGGGGEAGPHTRTPEGGCHGWLKPVLPPLSGCWERTASPVILNLCWRKRARWNMKGSAHGC